jgi:hypothetical protein
MARSGTFNIPVAPPILMMSLYHGILDKFETGGMAPTRATLKLMLLATSDNR